MSRRDRMGFSLLELSAVLAIISVILVFGLNIATTALSGSDRITTQERLLAVQKALDNYAKVHGFLPCPASRASVPSDSGFGVEARDGATYTTCTTSAGLVRAPAAGNPFAYIGAVPVRTLGLPDNYAGDAWGNKLMYAVSASHVGTMGSYLNTDGPITIYTGDRTLTSYIHTINRTSTGLNTNGPAVVYVVVSHGADGKGAYPFNGTAIVTACGASANNDVENCDDANLNFWDAPYNDGDQAATFFDDYIVWRSNLLDRLPTANGGDTTTAVTCTGACELWCAKCDTDYPPMFATYAICARTITSTSPCEALCEYAYPANNTFCP